MPPLQKQTMRPFNSNKGLELRNMYSLKIKTFLGQFKKCQIPNTFVSFFNFHRTFIYVFNLLDNEYMNIVKRTLQT